MTWEWDTISASIGTVGGLLLSKAVESFVDSVRERSSDKSSARRQMLREDLQAACEAVSNCIVAVQACFVAVQGSPERRDLAAKALLEVGALGRKINAINAACDECGYGRIASALVIDFRRAATMRLEDASLGFVRDSDPAFAEILLTGHRLTQALTQARYRAV